MSGHQAKIVREAPDAADYNGTIDLSQGAGDARISCIMATRGFAFPARHAIACFRNQGYPNRELIIICAAANSEVKALVAQLCDPRIRFLEAPAATTVGALRNAAIAQATGELIAIWDDDDLSHPDRLTWQHAALGQGDSDACFLSSVILWWPARARLAISPTRRWENTMLIKKPFLPRYSGLRRGSDTVLVNALRASRRLVTMERPLAYCYIRHGRNLWGDDHFDRFFRAGRRPVAQPDYRRELGILTQWMPVADYEAELVAPARRIASR